MAGPAQQLDQERNGNLRVLDRDEDDDASKVRSPGHDLRTCASCGARTAFILDPAGTWFRCSHCGEYA
ncbi:MAG TPA: hypothetical protein VG602_05735 [Actinomycetota bacterium]|nr:hypothetical protein [Actinomycetota bacterium]